MISSWFLLALLSSVFAALGMYMHQRLHASTVASVVWLKILGLLIAIPALINFGLPDQPMFYILTFAAAMIWCINDLIYFEAVKNHGAALLARLTPLGIILAFVLWFIVRPDVFAVYLQDVPRLVAISAVIFVSVACGMSLRHCEFSWRALKDIWFIILAAAVGVILLKSAVDYAPKNQGVFGYVGFEALCMLCFYSVYFYFFRRKAYGEIFTPTGIKTGCIVGGLIVLSVITRTYAQRNVDQPAFVNMVSMLDVIWLIILTRLSGWKDDSNKIAGLGIVLAALALAFLKIR